MNIICQCEYGQSRSAACAAAIAEHFYHDGKEGENLLGKILMEIRAELQNGTE